MSHMLEQAIIDAEALKEAAQTSAQEAIIEHYADDIRSAVEKILEQDEMDLDPLASEDAELAALTVDEESGDPIVEELPLATTTDDGEYVTLDLDQLEEMMAAEIEEEGDLNVSEMSSREELAEDIDEDIEIELDESIIKALLEDVAELEETTKKGQKTEDDEEAYKYPSKGEEEEEGGHRKKKKAFTTKKGEKIKTGPTKGEKADVDPSKGEKTKSGRPAYEKKKKKPNFPYQENKQSQDEALLLNKQVQLENRIQFLEAKLEKYRTLTNSMKDKLQEVNLSNAKLLYQNRVLDSNSLNERQKDKIVETISNAKTVEETKIIFETLQSAVGSAVTHKPKSLNEVVTRRSSAFLPRKEEKRNDPFIERMKLLAGLKDK